MSRVMLDPAAYRAPLETLVVKHRMAYRQHLVDVLVAKEAEALHLAREIGDLEADRISVLDPLLRRAAEEHAAIAAKAGRAAVELAHEEERERLVWKAAELAREVGNLRASWSWRITAPLRRLYGLSLKYRGRDRS